MTFRRAITATAGLAGAYRAGLQALAPIDRERILPDQRRRIRGSLNLETALRSGRANDPIWDYGIGIAATARRDYALWIEVHSANSRHIETVIRKFKWLLRWLDQEAPELKRITPKRNFVWLASGRVALQPGSRQWLQIAREGLQLRTQQLNLDEFGKV